MTGGIRPATQVELLFFHVIDLLEENMPLKMTKRAQCSLCISPPKHVASVSTGNTITHMVYFEEAVCWLVYFRMYSSLRAPLLSHLCDRLQSQQDGVCMPMPVHGVFEDSFEKLVL